MLYTYYYVIWRDGISGCHKGDCDGSTGRTAVPKLPILVGELQATPRLGGWAKKQLKAAGHAAKRQERSTAGRQMVEQCHWLQNDDSLELTRYK